jgi:hypothetical protein
MANEIEVISPKDLLFTQSPLSAEQIALFYQKTPANKIQQRPAKGGGKWDYVQTGYVIDTLNRIFGYLWSFEILTNLEEAIKFAASGTCNVKGRLTACVGDKTIVKEQFGRCDVKYLTEPKLDADGNTVKDKYGNVVKVKTDKFLDLGNDLKGAASDALKKCASEFGLFRDIYHKEDFSELNIIGDDEKQQLEDLEIENAKKEMRKATTIAELRDIFTKFVPKIRTNKGVIASKNALKRKIMKKENENV